MGEVNLVIMASCCTNVQRNIRREYTYIAHNTYPTASCFSCLCKSWHVDFFRENMNKIAFLSFPHTAKFWSLKQLLKEDYTVNIMVADDLARTRDGVDMVFQDISASALDKLTKIQIPTIVFKTNKGSYHIYTQPCGETGYFSPWFSLQILQNKLRYFQIKWCMC